MNYNSHDKREKRNCSVYLTNILQNFDIYYIIVGRSEAFSKKIYSNIWKKGQK